MRTTFVNELINIANNDSNVYLLTGDLGYGALDDFIKKFPDRYINAGIAEQNMTGVAAGLALENNTVFTYSIGNFNTLRCLEQIRNDCLYHNANIKIVSIGCGFSYGYLGMTHHATEDLGVLRALPNIVIFSPADQEETKLITQLAYQYKGSCYIRLGKGGEKKIHIEEIKNYKMGDAIKIVDGSKCAIFTTGPILEECYAATLELKDKGVDVSLYSFPTIKPIDEKLIIECAQKLDFIVTVEEHNYIGGLGSAISEVVSELKEKKAYVRRLGVRDTYSTIVGSQSYLREQCGISKENIVREVLNNV